MSADGSMYVVGGAAGVVCDGRGFSDNESASGRLAEAISMVRYRAQYRAHGTRRTRAILQMSDRTSSRSLGCVAIQAAIGGLIA